MNAYIFRFTTGMVVVSALHGPTVAQSQLATAAQVAARMRGDLKCPAAVSAPTREGTVAVDDILGVRPGMAYDEAVRLILCSDPMLVKQEDNGRGVRVDTHGHRLRLAFEALPAEREKTGKEIFDEMQGRARDRTANRSTADLAPSQSRWFVTTFGLPGQERVLHVTRRERYPSERAPALDAVEQALITKYGVPNTRTRTPQSNAGLGAQSRLDWAYTPGGQRSAAKGPCGNFVSSPDSPVNFRAECGLTISARIVASPQNPGIAEYLEVGSIDQGRAVRQIEQTQAALAAITARHQTQQVEEAKRRGVAARL